MGGGLLQKRGDNGTQEGFFLFGRFSLKKKTRTKTEKNAKKKMPSWEKNAKKRLFEKKRGRIFFLFFLIAENTLLKRFFL